MKSIVPTEKLIDKIFIIRKQKVILDKDLAVLYGVETRTLKQSVRRNIKRFPPDFMFELTKKEFAIWRSQIVMSKSEQKGLRHLPFAFTEQGVAMLSSILKSEKAIEVNILIMRAFFKLREILSTQNKVKEKLKELEDKLKEHDGQIIQIINQLITPQPSPKKKIGFTID